MPNSMNEDEDQRKNTNMEDSTMTIDFLRARLLSERSVSSSARQRADELARRVVELEEQLKIVSLQRKKAEKATADVLAILETNGISDVSDEEYDSRSDQEGSICESKFDNNSAEDDGKVRASLNGRSLSWRSGKNSSLSIDKKNYSRRRRSSSSLVSTGSSSAQRAAKSCRQIRRRETRSAMEELQIDTGVLAIRNDEEAACSECFPNCSDTGADTSRAGSEEKDLVDNNERITDTHYFNRNDKDMESALEHQAQLIGKYQSEEKAQREWEEKFGENNSCTPDSFDAGNQSDVTEERDEIKASVPPLTSATTTYENQSNVGSGDVRFSKEEPENQSSVPEFAFSVSKEENNEEEPLPNSQVSSRVESHICLHKGVEACGNMKELAVVQHGSWSELESVLEALNQAKLSLKQNLNTTPLLEGGSTSRAIIQPPSEFLVQRGGSLNGLFRVPTDFQFQFEPHTARPNNLLAPPRYSTQPDHHKFLPSRSYMESNLNTYSADRHLSVPSFPYPGIQSTRTPGLETGLPFSSRYPYLEPQLTTTSLPSRLDVAGGVPPPPSSVTHPYLDTLPTSTRFDPGLDSGVPFSVRSPYLDHRLSSTTLPTSTRFDHGLDLGVPSSGRSPYLDRRLSSTTLPTYTRFEPGLDLGVPSSGRSPYLDHDLSTNLPSRRFEPGLDLGMHSSDRYTTYEDPRLSAGTGIPSSSRYAYDPTHSTMPDDRISTSRDNGMMPPAPPHFSFYDHNNNTPNMYR